MKYVLLLSLLYVSTSLSSQPPAAEDNAAVTALKKKLARRHSEAVVAIPRLQGDSPKSFERRVGSAIARLDNPASISKNTPETNNKD